MASFQISEQVYLLPLWPERLLHLLPAPWRLRLGRSAAQLAAAGTLSFALSVAASDFGLVHPVIICLPPCVLHSSLLLATTCLHMDLAADDRKHLSRAAIRAELGSAGIALWVHCVQALADLGKGPRGSKMLAAFSISTGRSLALLEATGYFLLGLSTLLSSLSLPDPGDRASAAVAQTALLCNGIASPAHLLWVVWEEWGVVRGVWAAFVGVGMAALAGELRKKEAAGG
ncbi:hypothetical protein DFJ74DRAFT_705899 [Hyaloraphidium curvatum]|nr:hypothetical protein DFJ74DRAFT_705899 [Hyaloraphidium curvatum]